VRNDILLMQSSNAKMTDRVDVTADVSVLARGIVTLMIAHRSLDDHGSQSALVQSVRWFRCDGDRTSNDAITKNRAHYCKFTAQSPLSGLGKKSPVR
jgi:hypothetical protein